MTSSLKSRIFGHLATGESVEAWTLRGSGGLELETITYGGIVTRLLVPDGDGHRADIVLGFKDLESYLAGHPYFGAIVGRVAGRIAGARFNLEGKTYKLLCNDPPNHLHGGLHGFDKKIWRAAPLEDHDGGVSLRLTCRSPDGEEGYPGTIDVTVTYTITSNNVFLIETEAVTDTPTPFNLTHHSYFNLAGEGTRSIADHELQIHADEYVDTDEHMTLLGRLRSVTGQANDFRQPRRLGSTIPHLFQNHGDLYLLREKPPDNPSYMRVPAARLVHPGSGRVLNVSTTETHLQLYTGAALDGSLTGKSGAPYARYAGVSLECEGYSDGANAPSLGNIILRPGHPQRQTTAYAFSIAVEDGTSSTRFNPNTQLRYSPPTPCKKDFRIGILGSGFIINDCHLVSYRRAGFNPVAIASRSREKAAQVAARHSISRACESYDELLDDPTIEVLDIAVPPKHQLELIHAACARGTVKGILAQKPLALNYAEAVEAVRCCEQAGILLSVNQNMRYDPSVHTVKTLLQEGVLGAPIFATIDMRGVPHWQPWQAETGSATLRIMSIHHLDCMRYWFGDPEHVFCSTRPDPRTGFPHTDGICTTILEYENGLRCVVIDDVWTGPIKEGCPGDIRIEWRIEGLDGLAIGDIGWCKDPCTTPSTMRYARKGDLGFHYFEPVESWFPDAFAGTMGQLLIALETGQPPAISARDNLQTIALVEAAFLSAEQHRMVSPREIISMNSTTKL